MPFKNQPADFKIIDVSMIDPDPAHPRKFIDDAHLKMLANSIREKGLIQPVVVRPADSAGRHALLVGERRWRAAVLAGEQQIPAIVRACDDGEALEIRVFENMGQGVRVPLETREMAAAVQRVAERFETREAAAEHLGRSPAWVAQTTAAANLTPKVAALLDAGQISSCATAVKLDKLVQKNAAKAEALIAQINHGEKLPKKIVDDALSSEGGRRKKQADVAEQAEPDSSIPEGSADGNSDAFASNTLRVEPTGVTTHTQDDVELTGALAPGSASPRRSVTGKMKLVAEILGLADDDEEQVLARLIDEFLALKAVDSDTR